jgi:hypothetical protein
MTAATVTTRTSSGIRRTRVTSDHLDDADTGSAGPKEKAVSVCVRRTALLLNAPFVEYASPRRA